MWGWCSGGQRVVAFTVGAVQAVATRVVYQRIEEGSLFAQNGSEGFVLVSAAWWQEISVAGKARFCEAGTASSPRHARTPQHVYIA